MHAGKLYIILKNGLNPGTVHYQKLLHGFSYSLAQKVCNTIIKLPLIGFLNENLCQQDLYLMHK